MKTWVALFVKEWKDNRYLMAFLVIVLVALQAYGWYHFDHELIRGKEGGWRLLPFVFGVLTCTIAPPFLLARSVSSEFKSETYYQWFSLPVNRWVTVLCKYAVALSNGFILWMIAVGSMVLLVISHVMTEDKWAQFKAAFSMATYSEIFGFLMDLCVVFVLPALLHMLLLLALVTAMEGVKFSVRRFQGLAALVFFGSMVFLYARFYKTVVGFLGFLGTYDTAGFWAEGPMKGVIEWSHLAYPFIALTLLLVIGLWLFEKRVEI